MTEEKAPKTFPELFYFYQNRVKLFYAAVQAENELPTEILFELNASLDHLSRHYIYGEDEAQVVSKAFSHMKRACLDVFKITLRETLVKVEELKKIDISLIDNGDFEPQLKQLIHKIKEGATEARQLEGDTLSAADDDEVPAFKRWIPVYEDCLTVQQDFYLHKSVDWAKKKSKWISVKALVISSVISALIGAGITWALGG